MDKIERSCITILDELKRLRFTKSELVLLERLFTKIVEDTKKLLAST